MGYFNQILRKRMNPINKTTGLVIFKFQFLNHHGAGAEKK